MGSDAATRQEVYQQLVTAKNAISTLSVEDVLRKDLKCIDGPGLRPIAISSLAGQLAEDFISTDGGRTSKDLSSFCSQSLFRAIVILGIRNQDPANIERDLAVYSSDVPLLQKVGLFIQL